MDELAGDGERLAAGDEDPQVRDASQGALGQLGDPADHVLAVVEEEQDRPALEMLQQGLQHGVGRAFQDSDRLGHSLGDGLRSGEGRQVDVPHATAELHQPVGHRLERQPRLADPTDPGEGHQRGTVHE